MDRIPEVTKNLIIVNLLMFLGMLVADKYGYDLNDYLGLHFMLADNFNPAQFITYMFMHADFSHIFFNMFAVWMFGSVLERYWGPKKFLFYYIVCGIGAGIIQEAVQFATFFMMGLDGYEIVSLPTGQTLAMSEYLNGWCTIGASGAVFGILLGFGMSFPEQRMFIFPLPFPIKAKIFVIGYAVIELLLGISNNIHDNVAHFAHLGGMLFGLIMILYWRRNRWRQ